MKDNRESWGKSRLGELQDRWPVGEDGQFEEPAFLKHCVETDLEAELTINLLGAYDIPVLKQYSNNGELSTVILGMSGTGVDLYVPLTRLEEAKQLCEGEPENERL